jgi:hypothetical protein
MTVMPAMPAGPAESLQEEIVADRYAELDARQPRRAAPPKPAMPQQATRGGPETRMSEHPVAHQPAAGPAPADDDLGLDERVTLSEALRLRMEVETAAAAARTLADSPEERLRLAIDNAPPLPSPQDWMTDSATMVLDPTQYPPGVLDGGAPELGGDLLVIEEETPASVTQPAEPAHRVERKDFKSLFARLRG